MEPIAALALKRLTLENFRNYANLRLDVDAPAVVLTGANGAGKTNLLEAISLLTPGRGLRSAPYGELVRHGSVAGWAVAAEGVSRGTPLSIGTAYNPTLHPPGQSRQVIIDQAVQKSPGTLGHNMRILWLTPAMDRLFSGPPVDRRRFFDRLAAAIEPDHISRVAAFERAMRERNHLLAGPGGEAAWLAGIEQQMAEHAVALAAGRLSALEALQSQAADLGGTSFPWVKLAIDGLIENSLKSTPAVQVEDHYRKMLRDSRALDRSAARALNGPHRSDLEVTHGPRNVDAAQCSTGEQKAMLISIVLAHAKAMKNTLGGMLPILLLDEVIAHLDAERRLGLFRELHLLGAQVWLTGTDRVLFDGMGNGTVYYAVNNGAIAPIG